MKFFRRLTSFGAAIALAGGLSVVTATPALAADYGISIADYCARNVSYALAPSRATNINNRWNGWRCGTRYGLVSVSVAVACQQQYNSRAIAVTVNTSASGWRCRF